MKLVKRIRPAVLALACLGIVIPRPCLSETSTVAKPELTITDVALQAGGVLCGQSLDGEGAPRAGVAIEIKWQNQQVAETTTDSEGRFSVSGLRGGLHTVTCEQGSAACRFWAANTSPPNVPNNLLLVSNPNVVRGGNDCQRFAMASLLSNPYFMALVIGTAIIVPVAINANNDDDSGS